MRRLFILVGVFAVITSAAAASNDDAELGKIAYGTYCASCHGLDGKGAGPMAGQLVNMPTDLTGLAKAAGGAFPAERVRATIDGRDMPAAHGNREMPLWGEMFVFESTGGGRAEDGMSEMTDELVEQRVGQLVAYIGSLQD